MPNPLEPIFTPAPADANILFAAAKAAAAALQHLPHEAGLPVATIFLGAGLPVEAVHAIAKLAGCKVYAQPTRRGSGEVVGIIEAFRFMYLGVEIRGQSLRRPTPEEVAGGGA